jgi:hypothetical protein
MSDFDIYRSDLAKSQLDYDARDYRRSLYTNTKSDHPANWATGEPCGCERGDDSAWERSGFRSGGPFVPGPLQAEHDPCGRVRPNAPDQPETRTPQRSRGRSR